MISQEIIIVGSQELYNNFRQWEHKLSDKMYEFIGKSSNEKFKVHIVFLL